jgi:hypothetical protein
MNDERFTPRQYPGVMVSSTFTDLKQHRAALMKVIEDQGLYTIAMERDAALADGTVIDSSLRKVRDASAYIGVISHKYGNIPDSPENNPGDFSLTEIEFREARRLGRPILIFIMGEDHDVKPADVERDPEKVIKLAAFREEVKRATAESRVHRVYEEFNSLREFELAAAQSVAHLRRLLDAGREASSAKVSGYTDGIPRPPVLYAEPRYIGSHAFLGRNVELSMLSDWAAPVDAHPMLLLEAIGGTGKSMLTWEWTVNHASAVRGDWAGTFWYSFYEKGAVMADFCRRALAYMTGERLDDLLKKRQSELAELLQRQLQARPWLLVLDGLERVLVAYHRYDAAQVADEEATSGDRIARRDPAAAIRPEDDELLRDLTDSAPSKILITSRLMPHILLNQADQPIPGVRHEHLPGLHPEDAEAMLHACGIRGSSPVIQTYLRQHCDCHPLVTGVVAGLVRHYLPARGYFDAWAADPTHGGHLNLAELDLVQKRNHILQSAIAALPSKDRQLLSTLALLSEAVDYALLDALNPHFPPKGQTVPEQDSPDSTEERKARRRSMSEPARRQAAARELARTVRSLERRGLLQYDRQADRYDLHPVVRGYASGRLRAEDRDRLGRRVVDYFSQQARDPYERAETLDDIRNGLQLVRTLLQMGRLQRAAEVFMEGLDRALLFNLESYDEILSLTRPFFANNWTLPAAGLHDFTFARIANETAIAFDKLGHLEQALEVYEAVLQVELKRSNINGLRVILTNMGHLLAEQDRLARADELSLLKLELAELLDNSDELFRARLDRFWQLAEIGRWEAADAMWWALDRMGRDWPRSLYRPGEAERAYAYFQFWRGRLREEHLIIAEELAHAGRNRLSIRSLHALRAEWYLERREWELAVESLHQAIRMARQAGRGDTLLETRLALAQLRLGQLSDPRDKAAKLSVRPDPADLALAELWHAIGDPERAAEHAITAYQLAWADGKPYVHAYELDRAAALLELLGKEIPRLPPYDPALDQPFRFEHRVRAVIKDLATQQRARGRSTRK